MAAMNDHAMREEAIVATALDLAEARGVAGVTTAGLARRLHFTEAALYRYFPGKGAIIASALRNLAERLFATMLLELMPEALELGHALEYQMERHVERFTLRGGLLLELLLVASAGRDGVLQSAGADFLQGYSERMVAYFQQLADLHLIGSTPAAPELARLWICQLLGGFVRCRLMREPWNPVEQTGFHAFIDQLKSTGSLAAS
jgi:AcrR family transcriptional regulator